MSCSTKKDKFLNRQYHALTTKYNVLYNGNLAFEKGLAQVENTYVDDYSEILPAEPFSFYAEQKFGEEEKPIGQSDFDRAEEKAVKAIQKHSMLIDGEERNYKVDEAYILMAKSRYYTKRFGPALEAIEYTIKNYPSADLIYETVIWRAKCNIHIGNEEFGKRALRRMLGAPKLKPKTRQAAEIGIVMALEKTPDSLDQIITHLENSLDAVDKGSVASRAAFILGQAYRKKNDIVASDEAFDRVINMKNGLYKFKVQSKLEKINNHIDDLSTDAFLKEVNKLIFITKNRPYVGKLLYEKGLIYEAADSIQLAKQFLTESVQSSKNDVNQAILSYEKLGDISYGLKKYSQAKSYYDSLINVTRNPKAKKVIQIKRKSKSLEKIVGLESAVTANDSLLKIASMSPDALETFFANHIEIIKEQEKRQRVKEAKALAKLNSTSGFGENNEWYFYNSKLRLKGKKEFAELWNVKAKSKNWYAFSLNRRSNLAEKKDTVVKVKTKGFDKYSTEYYTSRINKEPRFLDSITKIRDLNYYELGNAYYSQLAEKELSVNKFEKLLAFNPSSDLKIGTYYRLFKIYSESGETDKANEYRLRLLQDYPNSSFTKLANNDTSTADEEVDSDIKCYEAIYNLYAVNSIEAAAEEMEGALLNYAGSVIAPKYALLNAYIQAKVKGNEEFTQLLKDVVLRYPNTPESEKAAQILKDNKSLKK